MRRHRYAAPLALISALLLLAPAVASAQGRETGARIAVSGTQVSIQYPSQFDQAVLRVSKVGQDDVWTETFANGSAISGDLSALLGGAVADGFYRYEIAFTWPDSPAQTVSGAFKVSGGQIQMGNENPAASGGPVPPAADSFISGNLRVSGGGCFGCPDGTSILTGKILSVDVRNRDASAINAQTRYILDPSGTFASSWLVGNSAGDFVIQGPSSFFGMTGGTGAVGIGTSSPAGELHVRKPDTNVDLFVERTGTGASVALLSAQADSVAFGTLSADPFLIATNNVTRIIIGAGGGVAVQGDFSATGTKNFVEDHPTDPTKSIYYAAMEGPEAGTYVRGSANLVRGVAIIDLPEHFGMTTAEEGLTVQLTPRGEWLQAYVVEVSPRKLVLRARGGKSGRIDYRVEGVRKGYTDYQVIRSKSDGK